MGLQGLLQLAEREIGKEINQGERRKRRPLEGGK
jgi:hypothetical protein